MKCRYGNIWCLLLCLLLGLGSVQKAYGQATDANDSIFVVKDSASVFPVDSLVQRDSIAPADSTSSGNFQSAGSRDIKTTVNYHARDSIVFSVNLKKAYLHGGYDEKGFGQAHVDYGEISMDAGYIEIDWSTGMVTAYPLVDTAGYLTAIPHFKDGDDIYDADTMKYNYRTKKAYISGIVTQEEEWLIEGDEVLKDENNNMYIKDGSFCPCEDPNEGTYIAANKIKVIPNNKVITGPFNLHIGHVPTPIGFIFGVFPTPKERSSGLILPTYGQSQNRGFFLRDGGFYWSVNDYVGIKFLGETYAYGGGGVQMNTNYKKRYGFDGNLDLSYRRQVFNGDESRLAEIRTETTDYSIVWNHRPVSTSGSRFSSSVNYATTTNNTNNARAAQDYFNNTLSSNINYSVPFRGTPFNLNVNLRHNQNNQTEIYTFTLPDVALTMNRQFPFKKIAKGKSKADDFLKSISVAYNYNFRNEISNRPLSYGGLNKLETDTLESDTLPITPEFFGELLDRARNGMRHSIPINANVKLGAFSINPSFNYESIWLFKRYEFEPTFDSVNNVIINEVNQFSALGNYDFGANVNTRIYGFFDFKTRRKRMMRHVITPTVGVRYSPNYTLPEDRLQNERQIRLYSGPQEQRLVSKYLNSIYSPNTSGEQAALTFNLTNTFEMKYLQRPDSAAKEKEPKYKYTKIFENIAASGSYNFAADSLKLSAIRLRANTNLFSIFNINANASFQPYVYDSSNGVTRLIDEFEFNRSGRLATLDDASFNIGANFSPGMFKKSNNDQANSEPALEDETFLNQRYVNFNIPWTIGFSYNILYRNTPFPSAEQVFSDQLTQSLNLNGDVRLTDNWKLGYRASYDFQSKQLVYPNVSIYRDLGCWEMSMRWVPFGPRQEYEFYISMKPEMLKDLKLQRRRNWYDR